MDRGPNLGPLPQPLALRCTLMVPTSLLCPPARKFHHESATEARPGCFVPWTAEMPGSMNLHALVGRLACAAEVRRADGYRLLTRPTGLRFLDGSARTPDRLAIKVTSF